LDLHIHPPEILAHKPLSETSSPRLERDLSLAQATAINMIDMVGIGPFITVSFVVGALQGPLCLLAWLLGALLAYMDGMVWAEMGAKWPEAGGSYVFLQKIFKGRLGRLMAFLFIWQTTIQAPLVVASGAIGFAQYVSYLFPIGQIGSFLFGNFQWDMGWGQLTDQDIGYKLVSGCLVLLLTLLLYRNIKSIGRISVVLSVITIGTLLWLIFSGLGHVRPERILAKSLWHIDLNALFFVALGQASLKSVYSYLGYYNVCHLGAEIRQPAQNIPRAIFISITGIALLYLAMQTVLLGTLPWQEIAQSDFVVSLYFERIYNTWVAQIATALVLCIAVASLFSVILGYSRVPYAAALNGDFFPVFARVHATKKFPHISLLALCGLAFLFSLLFKMKEVITAIITMRILIQFVSQAIGVVVWHSRSRQEARPYRMPLFPIPAVISIIIWLFILLCSDAAYIFFALGIIATGIALYFLKEFIVHRDK
jgi:amino acid transporter